MSCSLQGARNAICDSTRLPDNNYRSLLCSKDGAKNSVLGDILGVVNGIFNVLYFLPCEA